MDKRDDIVRKLKYLKAKFEHGSTTEAEATAAMNKYNDLMAKYRLTETDLNVRASTISMGVFHGEDFAFGELAPMAWLITPIAKVSETKGVCFDKSIGMFFGTKADVQHAEFLWSRCEESLNMAWNAYYLSPEYNKYLVKGLVANAIREAFIQGWLQRMTARLLEMVPENPTSERNALVVLKNQLITQAMGEAAKTKSSNAITIHGHSIIHYHGGLEAEKVTLRKETEATKLLSYTGEE